MAQVQIRKALCFCAGLLATILLALNQAAEAAGSSTSAIASSCKNTLYPESCESALVSMAASPSHTPLDLFVLSAEFARNQAQSAQQLAHRLKLSAKELATAAVEDCMELLDDSLRRLSDVLDAKRNPSFDDVRTWLSAAMTNQQTCLDGLDSGQSARGNDVIAAQARKLTQLISNSLALYVSLLQGPTKKPSGSRKLLSGDFPEWTTAGDRKLLEASVEDMGPKLVVRQDGKGTHVTIAAAIAAASLAGTGGRTVIHVAAGTYGESLKIPSHGSNILLVGDGKGKTVITGSKNAQGGTTTFRSATLAAFGDGFMMRDLTVQNTAGPGNHQAVALLVKSDKSVIYRCAIVGYQDTLYSHSNRQFYRDTDIYGTVDFIFGNSAAVFQNCNINPRKSGWGFITAQGRTDPNQNTGFSIQGCRIQGESGTQTFLGRPWHKYSRTVFMQSFLDGSVRPAGWAEWSGGSSLNTLYYGEYMNSGPGAGTGSRVKWAGYHPDMSTADAMKFTVAELISGNSWLPSTGVEFSSGLGG